MSQHPTNFSFLPHHSLNTVVSNSGYIYHQNGIHIKILQLLSGSSGLYGALWPEIIRAAGWVERFRTLRFVNHFFQTVCNELMGHRRSERAKKRHIRWLGNPRQRPGIPFVMNPSLYDSEWRLWGATKLRFARQEAFMHFCKLGDVDPYSFVVWEPHGHWVQNYITYIWASESRDLVFETRKNPMENNGYCLDIGVIGLESKTVAMFDYLKEGMQEPSRPKHPANITEWSEMAWAREWI